jgi:hypothetical protein
MLYDVKFLCKHLTNMLFELGKMETEITLAGVYRMFSYVAESLVPSKLFECVIFCLLNLTFFCLLYYRRKRPTNTVDLCRTAYL